MIFYRDVAVLMIFKLAAFLHLGSLKFRVCQRTTISMLICFPVKNLSEIGQSAAVLQLKNDFQYGGRLSS